LYIIALVDTPAQVACASKLFTVSLCGNGATEVPRYHIMVGMGSPVEKQEILMKSPSSTVTSPIWWSPKRSLKGLEEEQLIPEEYLIQQI